MHVWRDIGPELSVGLYLIAWVVTLLVTHLVSR
jgi:hypothetical protein